jgi:hypothetical protein
MLKLRVAGSNTPMPDPATGTAFFHQSSRLTVQLFHDASCTCWSSEYTDALTNDVESFAAKVP